MAVQSIYGSKEMEEYFTKSASRNTGNLGKDDFLNLLVTQLKYQDPLKPMEDKEFIAQMAQFSTLEQMQNMNKTFSNMMAFTMIGKKAVALSKDADSGELKEITGVVKSVKIANGKTYAVIDGKDIFIDDVTDVFDVAPVQQSESENITDYLGLVGKVVTTVFVDAKTLESMEITGDISELRIINNTIYSQLDNVNVVIDHISLNTEEKETFTDILKYLEENIGKEITAVIKKTMEQDGKTIERKVTVTGTVKSFEQSSEEGAISAVLDNIKVPVGNITSIR